MDSWRRPRRAVPFLDRQGPRQRIADRLRHEREAPSLVCVHAGYGGGSYSLVAEACHEYLSERDGVGYVEVQAREPDGREVSPSELLGQALRGLGLPDPDLPVSDAARVDTYQRLAAGETFLLVVRDAVTASQVEALVPHSAPEAVVVVTSRARFRTFRGTDVLYVALKELPPDAARQLLEVRLDGDHSRIDHAALTDILAFCAGHPMTIEMFAGHLRGRVHVATSLADKVRAVHADVLELPVMYPMVTAFDIACAGLERHLQECLLQVAQIPGPDFGVAAVAAVAGVAESTAADRLNELVDRCLLVSDDAGARYRFFPVLRRQARLRARESEGTPWCDETVGRVVSWYLTETVPRDAALSDRWRVGPAFREPVAAGSRPSRDEAIAWFEREWRNVVECVAAADRSGRPEVAAQLCVAVFKFLHMHRHVEPGLRVQAIGVDSAARAGDDALVMQMRQQRGTFRMMADDPTGARSDFEAALRSARLVDHALGEQSSLEWLGKIAAGQGAVADALGLYDDSGKVVHAAGAAIAADQRRRMLALLDLQRARAHGRVERWPEVVAAATRALAHFGSTRERENRAKCLVVLAAGLAGTGDRAAAAQSHLAAAELFDADGLRRPTAHALHDGGRLLDDPHRARGALERALALFEALGDATADDVRAALHDLI